ncbi:MAG TPA: Holliday junction resolvase RuvX [Candidatus Moranbacteria bacterium]|nr:Holliday junction resolvase RuvX [Candidatus Moranbacteria bacterium]
MTYQKEPKISHYLGIDYGRAKIGLALADTETKIAFVYGTLDNNKELFQNLVEIIRKEDVIKVIVGVPSYINREETEYPSEDFGYTLKSLIPDVELEFANEMFTTKMAEANLIEKRIKGIKKHDDEEAARIILQSWLDISDKEQVTSDKE